MRFAALLRNFPYDVGGAILEYIDLAFSTDGKKLVSLSGVPDFRMTLWY